MEDMAVALASCVERPDGKTSPEGLSAAARAPRATRWRSRTLRSGGGARRRADRQAVATLDEEWLRISAVDLDVWGSVADLSEEEFGRLAQEAEKACPVSNAIRANVEVRLRDNLLED